MANFAVWLTIKMSKGKIAQFITTSVLFFVDIATTTSTGARTDLILFYFIWGSSESAGISNVYNKRKLHTTVSRVDSGSW